MIERRIDFWVWRLPSFCFLVLEKSRVELIDDLADQVLDLLATEEETPLQNIFIEQISKIMAAVWSNLRERSGTLPTGRSILGTLVDAIGIFRTSPVVRMNSLEEEIIESTRKYKALAL